MGTWGYEAWSSDEAADFFKKAFKDSGIERHLSEGLKYSDAYAEIRAVSYLLIYLAKNAYTWPFTQELRKELIEKAIERMEAMLIPGSDFQQLCVGDGNMNKAIEQDLALLKEIFSSTE